MEELENGCLGIWEQLTDYLLCEWDIDTLPELPIKDRVRYEYNQNNWDWSRKSCTIFTAAWALSDLKNYRFSEAELKSMDELSYTRWRIRWEGWYVQSAVKCVADRWNESELSKKYWKVAYYRISKYEDNTIQWALDKLYTLDTNYNWNSNYNKDYKDDWILNGTEFWVATYGHSVGIIWENGTRSVKDNYYWRQYNIYGLEHKISEIKCYGSYLYIYVDVDNLKEVKRLNEMKVLTLRMIEDNSTMRHLTNDENYRVKLHDMNNRNREKLKDIEEQLAKYM